MQDRPTLNPFFAWVLAAALAALPAFAAAIGAVWLTAQLLGLSDEPLVGPKSLWLAWTGAGLIGTAVIVRPIENWVRRFGYGLGSVEEANGLDGGDRLADATGDALEAQLADELGRGKPHD